MNLSPKSETCHQNPKIVTDNDFFFEKMKAGGNFGCMDIICILVTWVTKLVTNILSIVSFTNANGSLHKIRLQTLQLFHKT